MGSARSPRNRGREEEKAAEAALSKSCQVLLRRGGRVVLRLAQPQLEGPIAAGGEVARQAGRVTCAIGAADTV